LIPLCQARFDALAVRMQTMILLGAATQISYYSLNIRNDFREDVWQPAVGTQGALIGDEGF